TRVDDASPPPALEKNDAPTRPEHRALLSADKEFHCPPASLQTITTKKLHLQVYECDKANRRVHDERSQVLLPCEFDKKAQSDYLPAIKVVGPSAADASLPDQSYRAPDLK